MLLFWVVESPSIRVLDLNFDVYHGVWRACEFELKQKDFLEITAEFQDKLQR